MRPRTFIALLCIAAMGWPLFAHAQRPAGPVIGFVHEGSSATSTETAAAFRDGLREMGYVEGRNVAIEYRWAEGQYDRLPALVSDLVRLQAAVIAGGGGPRSASAAKAATTTIPVVFTVGVDPVKYGLVASLGQPEGNVTGVTMFTDLLTVKRLELLRELLPNLASIAILVNPNNPNSEPQVREMQEASRSRGLQLHVLRAGAERDLEAAFAVLAKHRVGALVVSADPFLSSQKVGLVERAARHAVPAIYQWRDFPAIGGLMSYGSSNRDAYYRTGVYVGRILKGAKPSELPVLQPTKFELVVNTKAAKTLGLSVPQSILLRADELIE